MATLSPSAVDYVQAAKAGIESMEYIDDLVREYLLFRGFKRTLHALEQDLERDQDKGFNAGKIAGDLLSMAKELRDAELLEYWRYLSFRFFSHLSPKYQRTTRMFEKRLIRLFLVSAIEKGQRMRVREFMDKHGKTLGQQGGDWIPWLGLEYVDEPNSRPEFEAYFSDEWYASLKTSLADFVNTVFPAMAVPRILLFDRERREREVLKRKIELYEKQMDGETKITALDAVSGPSGLVEDHIGGIDAVTSPRTQPAAIATATNKEDAHAETHDASAGLLQASEPSSLLKISQEDIFLEHNSGISLARFSATGELIASYDDESILKIWTPDPAASVAAPKLKNELDYTVSAMAWDKKHAHLLYLYDENGYIHTLHANTNMMSRQLVAEKRHPWVQCMLAGSTGSALAVVSSSKPENTTDVMLQIWDAGASKMAAAKRLPHVATESHGVCAALNHNDKMVALGHSTGLVQLVDTRSLETVTTLKTRQRDLCSIDFSLDEDSLTVVTEVGGLTQWSLRKGGQMLAQSTLSIGAEDGGDIVSQDSRLDVDRVVFTPDKENVVVAPRDQCLVFNIDSAALTDTTRRHKDLVTCIDYAAGKSLSASDDGTIRVACYRKV
ncbi:hypothetical protein IW140_004077 [Coemansia sp. RSA 1813]|nr:hypothetical protein EV178_004136 [Coemansia sp. RSA 1646]KAJ1768952.1 hypothetical protein LPJ74_004438 [Coemansia sp. RSA 1843]KAJ2088315.1 hypothetical protein IW138_004292 [Coemansia sp. RSA 986]KAJ2213345.1 hypothetical protein EV179_003943 [Coemansia sp. RSA 487]KAJ2568171.1 hypothetical protein IW140_004077 [Coemansia sp. RSA 1813]